MRFDHQDLTRAAAGGNLPCSGCRLTRTRPKSSISVWAAMAPAFGPPPPCQYVPVYRVFNGHPDANHRYMTDVALRGRMVAKGRVMDGDGPDHVVMCAPQ